MTERVVQPEHSERAAYGGSCLWENCMKTIPELRAEGSIAANSGLWIWSAAVSLRYTRRVKSKVGPCRSTLRYRLVSMVLFFLFHPQVTNGRKMKTADGISGRAAGVAAQKLHAAFTRVCSRNHFCKLWCTSCRRPFSNTRSELVGQTKGEKKW